MAIGDRMNHDGLFAESFLGPSSRIPGFSPGFTYIGLLILVALMSIFLAATGLVWHMETRREKERELLFAGGQIRRAIAAYYEYSPGEKKFPATFDDLLLDRRYPATRRHLRRLYADPVAGDTNWGLVKGPAGEVFGVFSRSSETPIKQANFGSRDAGFEGKQRYSDWKFVYLPEEAASGTAAARKD